MFGFQALLCYQEPNQIRPNLHKNHIFSQDCDSAVGVNAINTLGTDFGNSQYDMNVALILKQGEYSDILTLKNVLTLTLYTSHKDRGAAAHANTLTRSNPALTSAPSTVTVRVVTSTECTKRHNVQEHLHQLTHSYTHKCAFCCLIRDSLRRDAVLYFFFSSVPPPFLSANAEIIAACVVTPMCRVELRKGCLMRETCAVGWSAAWVLWRAK